MSEPTKDTAGKYWVVQPMADYYAAWRQSGLHAHPYVDRKWEISEWYTEQPGDLPTDSCGESYGWAECRSRQQAKDIAETFARLHGGTVFELDIVSKGACDPNDYDIRDWS